jgi:hypothetical protein
MGQFIERRAMSTPLTVCYVTGRQVPRWEWFVDALCNQVAPGQWPSLQVILIDGRLWYKGFGKDYKDNNIAFSNPFFHEPERRQELAAIVGGRFEYLHIPPKPCVQQGPFRLTQKDWFCASNTRNTGIIAAKHPYIVFIDDLSLPGELWLGQAMHAAEHGYVVAGMYKKVNKLTVAGGRLVSCEEFPAGVDSRWSSGSAAGIVPWHGSGIYGCSLGFPVERALQVDGFEPACNGSGGEDYDFGIRIERSGALIMLNRNLFTLESEEDHHTQPFKDVAARDRRLVSRERLPAGYDGYQMPNQAEKYFSDHVLLNRVRNENRITPILPEGLREIRGKFHATGLVPVPREPTTDWRDGVALKDL